MTVRIATLGLLLVVATQVTATEHWLVLHAGYNQYGMSAVTDAPTTYRGYTFEPGSLDDGGSWGAAIDFVITPRWAAGFAYERLGAETTGTRDGGSATASIPLHLFKATGTCRPWFGERYAVGLGAAAGLGNVGGEVETASDSGFDVSGEPSGSCFLLEGQVSAEYQVARPLRVFAAAGWRVADVSQITIGGVALVRDDTGEIVDFKYGGFFARVGIKLKLPTRSATD